MYKPKIGRKFTRRYKGCLNLFDMLRPKPYCYVAKIAYFRFYKVSLSAGIKNERGPLLIYRVRFWKTVKQYKHRKPTP